MNDINLNTSELLVALVKVEKIKSNLSNLSNSINSLNLSSELSSASKLYSMKSMASTISKSADKLYQLIEKNISLISDFSVDLQVLFTLYKKGYINEEGEWLVDPSDNVELGMIYDQTLYKDIKYGAGTLASNGCGFFSLLSVITCKTGHVFSNDEITKLANYAMEEKGLGNDQLMERLATLLSKEYNFTWKKGSIDKLTSSVKNGTAVIVLTNSSSHFVPITGILENGNLVVNDTSGGAYRGSVVHQKRVDELGFNWKNGEINISIRGSDQNKDGENDDVWYFDFKDVDYNSTNVNDISGVNANNNLFNLGSFLTGLFGSSEDKNDNLLSTDGINSYSTVPHYFQNSFAYCGPTCLAMIASYYNNKEILPDDVAERYKSHYIDGSGNASWTMITAANEGYDLPLQEEVYYRFDSDFYKVKDALKSGCKVIACANDHIGDSPFTSGGHFIVLDGVNEDGKVTVLDPNKVNYNTGANTVLSDGFENGFEDSVFYVWEM